MLDAKTTMKAEEAFASCWYYFFRPTQKPWVLCHWITFQRKDLI